MSKLFACLQHTWKDEEETDLFETVNKHHDHLLGIALLEESEKRDATVKLKVCINAQPSLDCSGADLSCSIECRTS